MDVRQRVVDEFVRRLAGSSGIEHSLLEELARLVSGGSVSQEELLDLFRAAADHES
jgi:hypothetical protein